MGNARLMGLKPTILRKMDQVLSNVQVEILSELEKHRGKLLFPENTDLYRGKIHRGENYLGLPWLALDFPAYYTKEKICAFRVFFWWGKGFSTSLVMNKNDWSEAIVPNEIVKSQENTLLLQDDSPWKFHPEDGRWQQANGLNLAQEIQVRGSIRLLRSYALSQVDELPGLASNDLNDFATLCGLIKA